MRQILRMGVILLGYMVIAGLRPTFGAERVTAKTDSNSVQLGGGQKKKTPPKFRPLPKVFPKPKFVWPQLPNGGTRGTTVHVVRPTGQPRVAPASIPQPKSQVRPNSPVRANVPVLRNALPPLSYAAHDTLESGEWGDMGGGPAFGSPDDPAPSRDDEEWNESEDAPLESPEDAGDEAGESHTEELPAGNARNQEQNDPAPAEISGGDSSSSSDSPSESSSSSEPDHGSNDGDELGTTADSDDGEELGTTAPSTPTEDPGSDSAGAGGNDERKPGGKTPPRNDDRKPDRRKPSRSGGGQTTKPSGPKRPPFTGGHPTNSSGGGPSRPNRDRSPPATGASGGGGGNQPPAPSAPPNQPTPPLPADDGQVRPENNDDDMNTEEAEETLKDTAIDVLKKGLEWIVKGGGGAATATQVVTDLVDENNQSNLEYMQGIDGDQVQRIEGPSPTPGAYVHAAEGGTAWKGPDGQWYSHPDPKFQPKSPASEVLHGDGKGGVRRQGPNGVPDSRPKDREAEVIKKVGGGNVR